MNILARKKQLKQQLDNFATFMWRGHSSEEYGAFIINEKNSLKFFNGPQFSNKYNTPFLQNSADLLGVEFKLPQTIDFKIGIYGFTIEEYRQILNWLNPLVIDYLSFNFDLEYSYLVKLSNIGDSPRYILGQENNQEYYYTELSLKWELQGQACLRSRKPYDIISTSGGSSNNLEYNFSFYENQSFSSFLDTPIFFEFVLEPESKSEQSELTNSYKISFDLYEKNEMQQWNQVQNLFTIILNPLFYSKTKKNPSVKQGQNGVDSNYTFSYDSESGLLLYSKGDSYTLLNLMTQTNSGDYMVKSMSVSKFFMPGKSLHEHINSYQNYSFKLTLTNLGSGNNMKLKEDNITFTIYKRTNVI